MHILFKMFNSKIIHLILNRTLYIWLSLPLSLHQVNNNYQISIKLIILKCLENIISNLERMFNCNLWELEIIFLKLVNIIISCLFWCTVVLGMLVWMHSNSFKLFVKLWRNMMLLQLMIYLKHLFCRCKVMCLRKFQCYCTDSFKHMCLKSLNNKLLN